MIIDVHGHLGCDCVGDVEASEEDLVKAYEKHQVAGAIIQPFIPRPYVEENRKIHDRIQALCKKYPGKFWGMVSIWPHFFREDYKKEAERCIKELGFVGFKLNPLNHACNPASLDGMNMFETAEELGVPMMVHTGSGIPSSDPSNVLPAARRFPKLKIVLSHAGSNLFTLSAITLAKDFENIYLEVSWCALHNVKKMLNAVGPGKIMFASDHASNIPVELEKFRSLGLSVNELEQCLSGTAIKVFGLNIGKNQQ